MLSIGLGLYTGQRPPGSRGPAYRDAVPLALAAERSGFDSIWVSEHHGWPDGYLPSPLVVLAAMAAATERITLGTAVVLAPLQHPRRLVEDATVVDHLSAGRLVLGLGLGYVDEEYELFGVDRPTRAARLEQSIAVLRRGLEAPPPLRTGAPPIWIGGYAEQALARAARLADGHLVGRGEPHIVAAANAALETTPRQTFARAVIATCVLDDDGGHGDSARDAFTTQQLAYERMQRGRRVYGGLVNDPAGAAGLAAGSIDAYIQVAGASADVTAALVRLAEQLAGWEQRHLILRIVFPGEPLAMQVQRIETFGSAVLPEVRDAVT